MSKNEAPAPHPRAKDRNVKIIQISSFLIGANPAGGAVTCVLGLGDDGRVYDWSYFEGEWLENWKLPRERDAEKRIMAMSGAGGAIAPVVPVNRQARRASKAQGKKGKR